MSIPRTAIVTGGAGFIGSHLARMLAARGCEPILLSRPGTSLGHTSNLGRVLHADLIDFESVRGIMRHEKPDLLFHVAGTRGRNDDRGPFVACTEVNISATISLIEAASQAGIARIIILGSAEEYGNQPGPLYERLPPLTDSPYGLSKAMATRIALAMHQSTGCPVVVIRPFTVYGPGQPTDMFAAEAVEAALRNSDFRMSLGTQKRDLVYIDDVIQGLISAAEAPGIEGQVINLGSGTAHSLRHVAERIWTLTGATSRIIFGARSAAGDSLTDTLADISLARRLLGWEPRFDLDQGLSETITCRRRELARRELLCQVS